MSDKIVKSENEWLSSLTPEQYRVTRQGATERPFGGAYVDCKTVGEYLCVCCGEALFSSATKYDSRSGWPSFSQPIVESAIGDQADTSLGMTRTEVRCARCDAHLGHVFPDGPEPTGLRYCINSASLQLMPSSGDKAP